MNEQIRASVISAKHPCKTETHANTETEARNHWDTSRALVFQSKFILNLKPYSIITFFSCIINISLKLVFPGVFFVRNLKKTSKQQK